jgi:hypothetical protein
MVGSAQNRKKLTAFLVQNGKHARILSKGIELGAAPGEERSEIWWGNGRPGLYLLIRGRRDLCCNITGDFKETSQRVLSILNQAQIG